MRKFFEIALLTLKARRRRRYFKFALFEPQNATLVTKIGEIWRRRRVFCILGAFLAIFIGPRRALGGGRGPSKEEYLLLCEFTDF